MKCIIDRFEGDQVIIELADQTMLTISKRIIPANAKEGDVLEICIDAQATAQRKQAMARLIKDLWQQ